MAQDRIEKVNDLLLELVKIHKAAEILICDNSEIRDLFELSGNVRWRAGEVEEERLRI